VLVLQLLLLLLSLCVFMHFATCRGKQKIGKTNKRSQGTTEAKAFYMQSKIKLKLNQQKLKVEKWQKGAGGTHLLSSFLLLHYYLLFFFFFFIYYKTNSGKICGGLPKEDIRAPRQRSRVRDGVPRATLSSILPESKSKNKSSTQERATAQAKAAKRSAASASL